MLQSVATASYTLQTRLSRPELQAAKGRRAAAPINTNNNDGTDSSYPISTDPTATNSPMADADERNQELGSDDEGDGGKGGKSKSRRELPAGAVQTLKAWLLSPEHFTHPYPTPQDQAMLMAKTGIDKKQLKNWFTNARRRIWKPMLKKQIEQGKLTTTGVAVPGAVPGLMVPAMPGAPGMDNPHSVQAMRAHYQQAVQQGQPQQQPQQVRKFQLPAEIDFRNALELLVSNILYSLSFSSCPGHGRRLWEPGVRAAAASYPAAATTTAATTTAATSSRPESFCAAVLPTAGRCVSSTCGHLVLSDGGNEPE